MDDEEAKSGDAYLTRATREYLWFSITLLCIMALVVGHSPA